MTLMKTLVYLKYLRFRNRSLLHTDVVGLVQDRCQVVSGHLGRFSKLFSKQACEVDAKPFEKGRAVDSEIWYRCTNICALKLFCQSVDKFKSLFAQGLVDMP